MRRYNPKEIESKWQKVWEDTTLYEVHADDATNKFYVIPMLPYTSGDLHIGHWYNFGPTDTIARWHRMQGKRVLHTIGFDSFGLPAENAAIKNRIPPAEWTRQNITKMTQQLKTIGASYDWTKQIATSDPSYYRWNQWLFLQLYKKGLAQRAKAVVNWCPKDQTVLANEQVVGEKNVCERCGTPVVQKELEQWFFKITNYTERLLGDLEKVDWPRRVKTMQQNWIGKSQGALIDFKVEEQDQKITVFTTRPDTLFGATYMVLAPEHPVVERLTNTEQQTKVSDYVSLTQRKTELERQTAEKDKTGVFTGSYAINPANKEKIPIWIADYVLMNYGTGAIMAVPAHDERDWQFAKKHKLPIRKVIEPVFIQTSEPGAIRKDLPFVERDAISAIVKHWSEDKYIGLKWKEVAWGTFITGGIEKGQTPEEAAIAEITEETGYLHPVLKRSLPKTHSQFYHVPKKENRFAHFHKFYFELADGEKKNIAAEEKNRHEIVWLKPDEVEAFLTPDGHKYDWMVLQDGEQPYEDEGLMVDSGKYTGMESSLAREKIVIDLAEKNIAKEYTQYRLRDWLISRQRYWGTPIPIIYCEKCGIQPAREEDLPVLLPEEVEFEPTGQSPLSKISEFVNTKCPKCDGPARRETDTMDTFVDSSWYFLRYLDNRNDKAPFDVEVANKWAPVDHYIGGIEHAILHLLYARFVAKFYHDFHGLAFDEPFKKLTNQGIILGPDGQKMSKSRGNVINPDEQVTSYGADSLRLYLMFMGPYDQGGPYNLGGIAGTRRFLDRLWVLVGEFLEAKTVTQDHIKEARVVTVTHRTIKKVTQDLDKLSFNTAVAAMMSMINELYKIKAEDEIHASDGWRFALENLVQLLAPFAPHIAEELWQELDHETSVHLSKWPTWDESLVKEEMLTLAVQVNGKVKAEILVDPDVSEAVAIEAAKLDPKVSAFIAGKAIKKAIYVPGRLVSLVVG